MQRRAGLAGATAVLVSKSLGANDRVRLARIACGSRGRYVGGFSASYNLVAKRVGGIEFRVLPTEHGASASRPLDG